MLFWGILEKDLISVINFVLQFSESKLNLAYFDYFGLVLQKAFFNYYSMCKQVSLTNMWLWKRQLLACENCFILQIAIVHVLGSSRKKTVEDCLCSTVLGFRRSTWCGIEMALWFWEGIFALFDNSGLGLMTLFYHIWVRWVFSINKNFKYVRNIRCCEFSAQKLSSFCKKYKANSQKYAFWGGRRN